MDSEHKKRHAWEIDTTYGTGDIRLYLGCFALPMAGGVFLIVAGILEMEAAVDSGSGMLMVGIVLAFMGSVMVRRLYSRYRDLNRSNSRNKLTREEQGQS